MSFLNRGWAAPPGRISRLIRVGLMLCFVWLAGRFWNPYHGFTKLLQFDTVTESNMLPVLREAPIFIHRDAGSYDGQFYAQFAASPALEDPHLPTAIDNLGYRARRILLSWLAWAVGLGDPVTAVFAYAWLNGVLWFVLAVLLWRLFPVGDWRATTAWAGLLFAAGTLHSVRYALTDLLALTLLAGALWQLERGRDRQGLGWLSLAVLARETAVLGSAALLPGANANRSNWWRAVVRCSVVVLPLVGWMIYLKFAVGWPEAGQRNFSWPVLGFVTKWSDVFVDLQVETDHWLAASGLLVQLALTVQLLFLLLRPQWGNQWWRMGAAYGTLLLCLGPAVWEGVSSAAPRILLPLSLAFNVLSVRARAGVFWLVVGNLTVLNGIVALWAVPFDRGELSTQGTWSQRYLLETDSRWYTTESLGSARWSWCSQNGRLTLHTWPKQGSAKIQLHLQGYTARDLAISHAGKVAWEGNLSAKLQWIQLPELPTERGNLVLELRSEAAPYKGADGRELGFVCYGFKLD